MYVSPTMGAHGGKEIYWINAASMIDNCLKKTKLDPYLTPYMEKKKSQMVLNMMKEEQFRIWGYFGIGNTSLNMILKI